MVEEKEYGSDEEENVTWHPSRWMQQNKEGDVMSDATRTMTASGASGPLGQTPKQSHSVPVATPTSQEDSRPGATRHKQSKPSGCNPGRGCNPGQPDLVLTAEAMSMSITSALNNLTGFGYYFPDNDVKSSPPSDKISNQNAIKEFLSRQELQHPTNMVQSDNTQNYMAEEKKEETPAIIDLEDSVSGIERFPLPQLFDARLPALDTSEASSTLPSPVVLHRPVAIQAAGSMAGTPSTSSKCSPDRSNSSSYSSASNNADQELARVSAMASSTATIEDTGRWYSNSSPMARMRDHGARRASILDEEVPTTTPPEPKSQDQIKAEKQRKWKHKMEIAQKKKQQERRQLEDDSNDTRVDGGGFVELVLTSNFPAPEEIFYDLIRSRCGTVDDIASDSEEYSPYSSGASAASSEAEETRISDSKTKRQSKQRSSSRKLKSADAIDRRGKSKKSVKMSRTRSDVSQRTGSSSRSSIQKSASEGAEERYNTKGSRSSRGYATEDERRVRAPRDQSSRGYATEDERRVRAPRDPSPGAPLKRKMSKKGKVPVPRDPSPENHVFPTTRAEAGTAVQASPVPSIESLEGAHLVETPDRNRAISARREKLPQSLYQPPLGHGWDALEVQPLPIEREGRSRRKHSFTASVSKSTTVVDPSDKSFVKSFIHEVMTRGIQLHWHKEQASMTPNKVKMHLKPGYRTPANIFCGPRLGWFDVKDRDDTFGIDLFDIRSLDKATPNNLQEYPYAIPSRSIFLKLTRGRDFVFEASSEGEARRLIHGFRWIVARLTFNLIIGNMEVSCELLEIGLITENGQNRQKSPQTPLEEARWAKAMDDVTNQLIDKAILQD